MISGSILALVVLIILGWAVAQRSNFTIMKANGSDPTAHNFREKEVFNTGLLIKLISILVIGILIGALQPYKMERIDAGTIGVRVNLVGSDRGTSDVNYVTGWVVYNAYTQEIYEFPTFQQHIEYDNQQVILKGGFPTNITPTFNYKLRSEAVVSMFKELRLPIEEIEGGWLKTAIITSVNDVSNRWEVDQIFNQREAFELEIIVDCNKRIGEWFEVSQLRTNIKPPASLIKQIEAKTNAIQEEQAKLTEVAVVQAEGEKMIAQARADSAQAVITASGKANAAVIEAEGEAEAIRIKQKELTKEYNDYIRATRWNGVYPTTMAGDGMGILLDVRK